ncbi:MAG TPA: hypothetical protein VF651_09105 [Gammaproteobacteria bacterium]
MLDKLKSDFDTILELVNKAPTALQETAFKMILEQWFSANSISKSNSSTPGSVASSASSSLLVPSGIPDSVKPFLTANAITIEILERVFQPAGPGAQLLASSIPGNGRAGMLVSLSLLLCVKQALDTGVFTCTLKNLRELAAHYDCYDPTNFSATLKANKNYYKPRDRGEDLELSAAGMKKAGEIIKSIAAVA